MAGDELTLDDRIADALARSMDSSEWFTTAVKAYFERPQQEAESTKKEAVWQALVLLPAKSALDIPRSVDAVTTTLLIADYERLEAGQAEHMWYRGEREGLINLVIDAVGRDEVSRVASLLGGLECHTLRIKVYALGQTLVAKGKILAFGRVAGRTMAVPAEWYAGPPISREERAGFRSAVEGVAYVALKGLSDASMASKPGPKTGSKVGREKLAGAALRRLHQSNPAAKLTKGDAVTVLEAAGFSNRQAQKIWTNVGIEAWMKPGKVPNSIPRFSTADLSIHLGSLGG